MFLRDDVYGRATGALSSTEVVAAGISEWIGGRGYLFCGNAMKMPVSEMHGTDRGEGF